MNIKEKTLLRQRLGLAIQNIISKNKEQGVENSVTSLRKLAASSGVEYSIIQKITSGQKDPQFSTLVALAEGLDISIVQLVDEFQKLLDAQTSKSTKTRKSANVKG